MNKIKYIKNKQNNLQMKEEKLMKNVISNNLN